MTENSYTQNDHFTALDALVSISNFVPRTGVTGLKRLFCSFSKDVIRLIGPGA